MIVRDPELFGHSIVLRGSFAVAAFHPLWFADQGLIRNKEAGLAKTQIMDQQFLVFDLEWLHIEVTPDRFTAITAHESYFEIVRDLIIGTFKILEHTPLVMLGINYDVHVPHDSTLSWQDIQGRIVNKELIGNVFNAPKLQSIVFEDIRDYNRYTGVHVVKIEPSVKLEYGIYFGTNDHYKLQDERPKGSKAIVSILESEWLPASHKSREYWKGIIEAI